MMNESNEYLMEFNEINTVNDLMKMNEEHNVRDTKVESLLNPIYQEHPSIGLESAIHILTSLLCFHEDEVQRHIANNEAEKAATWQNDTNNLYQAITVLRDIQLWRYVKL